MTLRKAIITTSLTAAIIIGTLIEIHKQTIRGFHYG